MAVSINWATKVISVLQADITFLGGTNYQMDSDWFRLQLRDLEDDADGIVFPKTHNHSTQVLLGGVSYARIIEIINGYTITFEETGSPYSVSIIGSNNNILDVTNLGTVQIRSNNSAGLINVTEIQHDIFNGEVHYDGAFGEPGTVYPAGTPLQPVDNFPDAVFIANQRGFNDIHILGNATLDTGDDLENFRLIGQNAARSQIHINPAADTANCEVVEAFVSGTLDGGSILRQCVIQDLDYVNGFVFQCMLNPGTITLGGAVTANFLSCYSGVPGTGTPTIDCGGDGPALAMRGYVGGIKLTNKTGLAAISIDMNSGQLVLDSTVTAGTIVCRGVGKLVDWNGVHIHSSDSWNGGVTVVNEMNNPDHIAEHVWHYTESETPDAYPGSAGDRAEEIHEAHFNRRVWDKVGNTITIYEADGVTPKHVFNSNTDLSDIDPV